MKNNEISFDESRKLQFDMLKEIHNYCEKNSLCYYIAFGTLLGAVRHQGFIPWDDDLDIIMPYSDFIFFQNNYKSERYSVFSCMNDDKIGFEFGRIFDNRTYGIEGNAVVRGACVDIYLLHGTPDSIPQIKFNLFLRSFRENRIKLSRMRNFFVKKLHINRLVSFFPLNWYCRRYTKKMSSYSSASQNVAISGIRYSQRREPFLDRILIDFEGSQFYAPKGYDECLRIWYGDYMKLPPVEKRVPYHGFHNYWK